MTDFRALCSELVNDLEEYGEAVVDAGFGWVDPDTRELLIRVRAALAEQPVEPTDVELLKLTENVSTEHLYAHRGLPSNWDPGDYCSSPKGLIEFARAVLARWGQPATPIPVAERLPGPEDCDAEGKCWLLFKSASMKMTPVWSLVHRRSIFDGPYTHWLPINALPVPSNV